MARGTDPVSLRRGVPAPPERAGGRGHPSEDGPAARGSVPTLPGRADDPQGDRHRPSRAVERVDRGDDRRLRAGSRQADGTGTHAGARRDRPWHSAAIAPLQPGRRLGGLHERDAHAFPGDPSRAPRRHGGPPPRAAAQRLRPRLDAGREGSRLRRAAGAPDVLCLRRPEPRRGPRRPRTPTHARREGPRPRRLARRPGDRLRAQDGGPVGVVHDRARRQRAAADHGVGRGCRVERTALEPAGRCDRVRAPPPGRLARPGASRPRHRRRRAAHPRPGEGRGAHVDAGWGSRRLPFRSRRGLEPPRVAPRRPVAPPGDERARRGLPPLGQPRRPLGRVLVLLLHRLRRPGGAARPRVGARGGPFRGRPPGPATRPGAGRRSRQTLPSRVDAPAALLDAVGGDRERRGPLRLRHRGVGRALPPRVGRARHVRNGVRARQRERLLPVRPIPPHLARERSGHDRPLCRRPPADPAGQPAGRAAAAPHRALHPDALGHLAARARGGAGSRPPGGPRRSRRYRDGLGRQLSEVSIRTPSLRPRAPACASPGCTKDVRSAATSRSTR